MLLILRWEKEKHETWKAFLLTLSVLDFQKKNGKPLGNNTGGLGYSQIGRAADGHHPGPSLMRKQVVEFLHAVTYLRGRLAFCFNLFSFLERKNE